MRAAATCLQGQVALLPKQRERKPQLSVAKEGKKCEWSALAAAAAAVTEP